MMKRVWKFITVCAPDADRVEQEVKRRRDAAYKALSERRKRDPNFTVNPDTILNATADDETRKLMRKLAGVD